MLHCFALDFGSPIKIESVAAHAQSLVLETNTTYELNYNAEMDLK